MKISNIVASEKKLCEERSFMMAEKGSLWLLSLLFILLSISYPITAQNDTIESTTETPIDLTTTVFHTLEPTTAEPTTAEPTRTISPTPQPTTSPITDPTPSPTLKPNIASNTEKGDDRVYTQKMDATCKSEQHPGAITCKKVTDSQRTFWITAARDAICEGANYDQCTV